jgi:hypothetical protein
LLGHQPNAQKLIDAGLAAAEREPSVAIQAFKLHETIESVRAYLKTGVLPVAKAEEIKKPVEKKPVESTEIKKPVENKPVEPLVTKKPEEKKPAVTYELAPQPREKK